MVDWERVEAVMQNSLGWVRLWAASSLTWILGVTAFWLGRCIHANTEETTLLEGVGGTLSCLSMVIFPPIVLYLLGVLIAWAIQWLRP